jgi:heme/copper-type cytochrome/quinol oxidase subunit 3
MFSLTGIDPTRVPLLNTIVLLSRGVRVTLAHHRMQQGKSIVPGIVDTILLGAIFTLLQLFEYYTAPFSIRDRVIGTTFFVRTGFHGTHVLIGTLFLIVCLLRHKQTTPGVHIGYEFAI